MRGVRGPSHATHLEEELKLGTVVGQKVNEADIWIIVLVVNAQWARDKALKYCQGTACCARVLVGTAVIGERQRKKRCNFLVCAMAQ